MTASRSPTTCATSAHCYSSRNRACSGRRRPPLAFASTNSSTHRWRVRGGRNAITSGMPGVCRVPMWWSFRERLVPASHTSPPTFLIRATMCRCTALSGMRCGRGRDTRPPRPASVPNAPLRTRISMKPRYARMATVDSASTRNQRAMRSTAGDALDCVDAPRDAVRLEQASRHGPRARAIDAKHKERSWLLDFTEGAEGPQRDGIWNLRLTDERDARLCRDGLGDSIVGERFHAFVLDGTEQPQDSFELVGVHEPRHQPDDELVERHELAEESVGEVLSGRLDVRLSVTGPLLERPTEAHDLRADDVNDGLLERHAVAVGHDVVADGGEGIDLQRLSGWPGGDK